MQNFYRLGRATMTRLPEVQPGDIFFIIHTGNKLSKWISWFMDFPYSHCGLILEKTAERTYTCETSDFEVAYFDLEYYLNDPKVRLEILRLPISLATGLAIARESTQYTRTVFGYFQLLVSLSFREIVRKLFRRVIPNFIRQGMVCCHVVLYGCKKSGIKRLEELDVESIQTKETYELLRLCGAVPIFNK